MSGGITNLKNNALARSTHQQHFSSFSSSVAFLAASAAQSKRKRETFYGLIILARQDKIDVVLCAAVLCGGCRNVTGHHDALNFLINIEFY